MAMIESGVRIAGTNGFQSVEESLRFERLLVELSAGFINLSADQIDAAVENGLRRIVETLGIDRSTLSRVSAETGHFRSTHSWALSGLAPVPATTTSYSFPWVLATMRAGKPIVFSRLDELPPEAHADRRSYEQIGLRSHVALPVLVAGELLAVLGFGTLRRERTWSDELVDRLRRVADIFANVLARKRAQEDINRALGFERLLADISASLLRGPAGDLDNAIAKALQSSGEFLDVDRVVLWNLSGDRERYELVHHWIAYGAFGVPAAIASKGPAAGIFERVSRGEVVKLSSIDDLPREADADKKMLRGLGTQALLIVPLVMDGVTGGALSLASVRGTHAWPDALIPRVRLVGEVFASVLARQRSAKQIGDARVETAQYRERLAHLVRVHTVGEMSAAIAHEINQPLVAIENYAQAARRRLASGGAVDGAKLEELLDKICGQAARAGEVLKQLRSIVKKHESHAVECDLGKLVADTVKLAELESRLSETRVEVVVEPHLPAVLADEVQIQQVVLNLTRNAVEATGEAGIEDRTLAVEVASCGESELVVRVVDRGPGVEADEAERIFEPFYSTKGTGLGIGLGICRAIVEAHGGRLSHVPNPGGGAIFQFTLPIA